MADARDNHIKDIFLRVVAEADLAERARILDEACGADTALRQKIESLLATAGSVPEGFLEPPADVLSAAGLAREAASSEEAAGSELADIEQEGDVIDRYQLMEQIGEGGFGTVWLAEQLEPVTRKVALKIIKLGMDTRQVIARFEAERQALALMDHPNIASVLDAGCTRSGRPFFVMEYVRGTPILDYCDRARLSTRERLDLFGDVCHAILHAHQKGVIHRDIKPTNVLVAHHDGGATPTVIDFGIAKATAEQLTDKTLLTQQRQLLGTPAYMSPEQAELNGVDVDTRSDIYSLGVLLYELLTGLTPFDNETLSSGGLVEMIRIIREEEPRTPSSRLMSSADTAAKAAALQRTEPRRLGCVIRGDLDWIVMRCLEKDRTRRYSTVRELMADVQRHLDDEPVLARPPGMFYRCRKFVRRNRVGVACGTAVVLAVGLGVAGAVYGKISADVARAEAEERARELSLVAEFEGGLFRRAVPELMGGGLRAAILGAVPEDARESVEAGLAGVNFTSIALEAIRVNLLEPAHQCIVRDFGDDPRIQGQLLQALADSMAGFELYRSALGPQRAAHEIRRDALGSQHPDTLFSAGRLGFVLVSLGELARGEGALSEALAGHRAASGPDPKSYVSVLGYLGDLSMSQGRLDDARRFFEEALDKSRSLLGPDHEETVGCLRNVGRVHHEGGRLEDAKRYYEMALAGARRSFGDGHQSALAVGMSLAIVLRDLGEIEPAIRQHRRTADMALRLLGERHPLTLEALRTLGDVLRQHGDAEEAESVNQRAYDGMRSVHGPGAMRTVAVANSLINMHIARKRYAEAEARAREVLDAIPASAEHEAPADGIRSLLASIFIHHKRYGEAESLLLVIHEHRESAGTSVEMLELRAQSARRIAAFYRVHGKAEDAEAWAEKAREARSEWEAAAQK